MELRNHYIINNLIGQMIYIFANGIQIKDFVDPILTNLLGRLKMELGII